MEKYVYSFGGGKADGHGTMKDVLGGKGAGLAEMTNAGLPVPPGFTIATSACRLYFQNGNQTPAEILSPEGRGAGQTRGAARPETRQRGEAPAGFRALRRQVFHARHDGHHPEPGHERHGGRGVRAQDRQPALRLRQLPALHPDVRQRGDGNPQGQVRARFRRPEEEEEASSSIPS